MLERLCDADGRGHATMLLPLGDVDAKHEKTRDATQGLEAAEPHQRAYTRSTGAVNPAHKFRSLPKPSAQVYLAEIGRLSDNRRGSSARTRAEIRMNVLGKTYRRLSHIKSRMTTGLLGTYES